MDGCRLGRDVEAGGEGKKRIGSFIRMEIANGAPCCQLEPREQTTSSDFFFRAARILSLVGVCKRARNSRAGYAPRLLMRFKRGAAFTRLCASGYCLSPFAAFFSRAILFPVDQKEGSAGFLAPRLENRPISRDSWARVLAALGDGATEQRYARVADVYGNSCS